MFSKILVKLIDEAIIPAVVVLSMRIISIFIVAQATGTKIALEASGFVFTDPKVYKMMNSYSLLIMIICLALGILFILAKAFLFHDTHVKPGVTTRLFSYNLQSLIQSSFTLYTQGTIWISYLFLLVLITGVMSFLGSVYAWVSIVGLLVFVSSLVLFIIDIEKEMKKEDMSEPIYDTDTSFLESV